jgi:hypothetical protein
MIRFECPGCNAGLKAPAKKSGAALACPRCGTEVEVPRDGKSAPRPAAGRQAAGGRRLPPWLLLPIAAVPLAVLVVFAAVFILKRQPRQPEASARQGDVRPARKEDSHAARREVTLSDGGRRVSVLLAPELAAAGVFSPDGKRLLLAGKDGTLRLFDAGTGKEAKRLKVADSPPACLAVSPNNRLALCGDAGGTVTLLDLDSGVATRRLRGHKGRVLSVAFSPDGVHALSGGADRTARLWDLELFRPAWIAPLGANAAPFPACIPWAALHACVGTPAGREVRRLEGHASPVNCVAFTPDGLRAVTGGGAVVPGKPDEGRNDRGADCTVRLWDLASGHQTATLARHRSPLSCLACSPKGDLLVSGSVSPPALGYGPEYDVGAEVTPSLLLWQLPRGTR